MYSPAYTQQIKPIAFANTYTLTEADGFPGYNYVTHAQFSSTGKMYIKDFFGNFHITGNNFSKQIAGLKNITNSSNLYLQPDNELWIASEGGKEITILRNDSVSCMQF